MTVKILEALAKLDVGNDNHWTAEGLPRLDTVKFSAGDTTITRDMISAAAPTFSRSSPALPNTSPAVVVATPPAPEASDATDAAGVDDGAASETQQDDEEADGELEGLRQEHAKWVDRIAYCEKAKAEVEKALAEANAEADRCSQALSKLGGGETLQTQLSSYFARQQQLREEQGRRREALRRTGVKLEDILPSLMPIDKSMMRRNARGMKRPELGLSPAAVAALTSKK